MKALRKSDNYRRYPEQDDEDLLATSGVFRIVYRYLSHRITLRQAIEEASLLYDSRRKKAKVDSVRYYFFSFILVHIRLIDWVEKRSKSIYQESIQKGISRTRSKLISFRQTVAALPGVFAEIIGEFFLEIKRARLEQTEKKQKRKKELAVFKTSKIEDIVLWFRHMRRQVTSRRMVYLIFSVFLHILIFYLLKTYNPRYRLKKLEPFEMHAIQLVDATPQAKDKISTAGEEKNGEREREKSSEQPGKPGIRQSPRADIRTARKEEHRLPDYPDDSIPVKDIAQQEPEPQEKNIFKAEPQPRQREVVLAKNINPQERSRVNIPDTVMVKKQYRSKALMKRRPISPDIAALVSARPKDFTVERSAGSLSRTRRASLTPRMETSDFSPNILTSQQPRVEREKVIALSPGEPDFKKFMTEKTIEIKRERATLTRTRLNDPPKKTEYRSRIAFQRAKIADIITPEGDESDESGMSSYAIKGKKGDLLSGIKKKDSLMSSMAITLRTPLMREGFTVGDVPAEMLGKEEVPFSGPRPHSRIESQKGVGYFGRMAKGGPISFTEEKLTFKSKSRTILKREKVSTDELGNIEELEDFSEEERSSPVNMLKNKNKRSFSPTEKFAFSSASQYFQGREVEEDQKIQRAKSFAQMNSRDMDKEKDSLAHKKLAYKTDKTTQPILKKEVEKKISALDSLPNPEKKLTESGTIEIKANLPSGYITKEALYTLRGEIGSDVKRAFVTINDVTQMVTVKDGVFVAKVAMVEGINQVNVLAFSSKGEIGNKAYKILFQPQKAIPYIRLLAPENGLLGLREGDKVLVSGIINDKTIKHATLLLNNVQIKIKVKDGKFRHKIFLPGSRVNTFRISATGRNGMTGYSNMHTILIGADFDINNPRPY